MAWIPLSEGRSVGQTGHVTDHNKIHEWANTIQEGAPGTYFVDPSNGSDSNTGKTWHQAWASIARASSQANNHCRVYLSPHVHNVTTPAWFGDGARIYGVPITGNRVEWTNQSVISNSGSNIDHYIRFDNGLSQNNTYDMGIENVHFHASKVNQSAIYGQDANMGRIIDCRFTKNQWYGDFENKYLFRSRLISTVEGVDASWWEIRGNFTEHCALVDAQYTQPWNNWFVIENNIGISVPPAPPGGSDAGGWATAPYVIISGWGGRHSLLKNQFEVINSTSSIYAIDISDSYNVTLVANAFERIWNYRAINLTDCVSSQVIQGHGPAQNGGVYENGVARVSTSSVPVYFNNTTGNTFMVAPSRAL